MNAPAAAPSVPGMVQGLETIERKLQSVRRLMVDTLDGMRLYDDAQHRAHNDLDFLAGSLASIEDECAALRECLQPAVHEPPAA